MSAAVATRTATVLGTTADADDPGILKRYAAGPMPVMPVLAKPTAPTVEHQIAAVVAPEEPHRAALLGQLLEAANRLPLGDLRVIVWAVRRLPIAALQADLNARVDATREPAGTPNNYTPTTREEGALASWLVALRDISLVVLGPKGGAK